MRVITRWLLAACWCWTAALPGYAQFDTATVLGAVRDANGASVANATVTLRIVATGITANTQNDSEGNYQFNNVKIGVYQITDGARLRVDLAMKAGALSETVMISDEASRLLNDSYAYKAMTIVENPFGDGQAADRIALVLQEYCNKPDAYRRRCHTASRNGWTAQP